METTAARRAQIVHDLVPVVREVLAFEQDTPDVFTLEIEALPEAPPFAPGQFNMLYLPGVGEVPISISSDPHARRSLLHTIRAVGPVTRALGALRPGGQIGVRGPYGAAWPVDEARGQDLVVVAGGIGLAPLRPVLHHAIAQREQVGRVVLLYGARRPEDLLFQAALAGWAANHRIEIEITVDQAGGDWRGHVGVVTALIPRAHLDPARTVAMICGPEVMMRFTARELEKLGVPPQRIWVSMERNMKCAVGFCGHCQLGADFVCKDGPVFRFDRLVARLGIREI